ncbi:histidine phosphatase [Frigoribacterium sp. Leaf263]|uniref:histidine phosphatase family protein n=1 Tax=Frigoribacterium sp. Leaf263 TaxID=1736313 RepID=UPI0006FE1F78|nr:histidine phosphatase family protein [Frigoribacterium sp. Leaf263]KQO80149.1 histidine phosphatase [Frigoribacterium sp. Leaf263]
MRLLLIRHGQTPDNVAGRLGTEAPGPGLTELGRAQASAVPGALVGEDIGALFVSSLRRTHETVAPLASALSLDPVEVAGFREVIAGDLEARSDPEAVSTYMGTVVSWVTGELDRRLPGGEDGHEFFTRFDEAVAQVVASGHETVAVVSHGAAIRGWCGARAVGSALFVKEHPLENTGVVTLEGDPESGWRLLSWEGRPVGGPELDDDDLDPTGEAF